jgi:hypothetical protein
MTTPIHHPFPTRLIVENRRLTDEQETVIAHLAEIEAASAQTVIENRQLKTMMAQRGPKDVEQFHRAVAKVAELTESHSSLVAENAALRKALNRDSVDISGYFTQPTKNTGGPEETTANAKLRALVTRAEVAERKNTGFARLLEQMATGMLSEDETGEVSRAIQLSPVTRDVALGRLAEKWNWHALDNHVAEKNKVGIAPGPPFRSNRSLSWTAPSSRLPSPLHTKPLTPPCPRTHSCAAS